MATRNFALNTEPHVAEIGAIKLEFHPEVFGDEFMDAYVEMRDAQKAKGVDLDNLAEADPSDIRRTVRSLRLFLSRQMLEDSAARFLRLNVVKDGETVETFQDFDQAEAYAAQHGARVVDELRLPTRVIVELLEWVVELFGGGNRPTLSSAASSTPSRQAGRRGTGVSPSRASTRTPGR
ncbi:hypothetical protein QFZ66_005940 [Streptomyces sp. B4I13]|uniref:hypothetical protein n=1 Tax=Streptomyces sp. B4I13 TaxID=3042271 RepID=UPI00278B8A9B|nr:hypothetical protein [Streptomyces sp. B4I13]MDQ0962062.1 hypothetical protein [Streptomyces sp. B4I13]